MSFGVNTQGNLSFIITHMPFIWCPMYVLQGNTLGRLLLHGLVGSQREAERAHMATVAAGIERHISETNEELKVDPGDANRLFDDEALGSHAFSACGRAETPVGRKSLHPGCKCSGQHTTPYQTGRLNACMR